MNELLPLARDVAEALKARRATVAVAESSTGGLISATLLAVPGASAYFLGGGVIYTAPARRALLGITDETMRGLKPLSLDYVGLCARTVREKIGSTWGVGEIGAAGPTGTRYGHPAGISVLAVDGPLLLTRPVETGSSDRVANMRAFTRAALELLLEAVNKAG